MNDRELRFLIYRTFADTGRAPLHEHLLDWAKDRGALVLSLQRLDESHAIVLDTDGAIRMALPFSAVDTGHTVVAGERSWWANCAWDSLAIPVALGVDATIEAKWTDTGRPVDLHVIGDALNRYDGFIHFGIPAREWWDDIIET